MTSAIYPLARPSLLRTQAKQALFRPGWWAALASSLLFACANAVTPGVAATPQIAVASADSQQLVPLADKNNTSGPATATLTFLHDDRTRIVDAAGNEVQLRGVNLGGWLLWEAWIWEGDINALNLPAQAETNIRKQLTKLVGAEEFRKFEAAFYDSFITESDIAAIAAHGFNTVRILFNYRLLEDDSAPGQYKAHGWEVLDRLLGWLEKHRVYGVLSLGSAPGGQSSLFTADPGSVSLWDSPQNQERTIALWHAIAQRYRDRPGWAAYDLLNEPKPTSSDLVALYTRIVAGIRQVDTNHMVMVQGNEFALDFSPFTARLDANEAYTFHVYNWFDALTGETTLGKVQRVRNIASAHGLPLWNGEFGQDQYAVVEANRRIFERPDQGVSGWAYYTWKNAPNKYPQLYAIGRRSNAWKNVISWITAPWQHRQPSKEATLIGMREFLEDIKLQNCSVDVRMLAGLINR